MRRNTRAVYRAEKDTTVLLQYFQSIRHLADGEKEAVGFLPEAAYRDAIQQHRLVGMLAQEDGKSELAGFVLFSGVFPNARIQQVVASPKHRRAGVASALISDVVSQLEVRGYVTVTAAVASDLTAAQAFYESNGFFARTSRQGGAARGRTIILRARDLETASFFSLLEARTRASTNAIDLGLLRRSAGAAPLYAIDLNVLFDLVKNRSRSILANQLFGAALAHQIRLAVAPEFLVELQRTTIGEDPVLKLARHLPRLPPTADAETDQLSTLVHDIVFGSTGSNVGTPQSKSDAKHVAQAALARASGYVTSDGRLLASREKLLREIGLDVTSLDEFAALLFTEHRAQNTTHLKGDGFEVKTITPELLQRYLVDQKVPHYIITEFRPSQTTGNRWSARAIFEAGDVVGVSARIGPENIDAAARVMIHVRPDHVSCETFADHLLDVECSESCASGPITIETPKISGQATVRRAASLRGFIPARDGEALIKVALGQPVTAENWATISRQTRRRTGLWLPEAPPDSNSVVSGIQIQGPDGRRLTIRLSALEDALSPTIVMWPGRDGAIIPIAKSYADDLLGTGAQMSLFGSPEAAFVTRRTYFNSPRTVTLMRPGAPILFYESKRSGGQGAILAAARIVDVTIVPKTQVPEDLFKRAVVDDVESFSTSLDVLATTFDNLLRFPKPIGLDQLRKLNAVGTANLQTTTALEGAILSVILQQGWLRA